jgi:hypothetical protein
MKLPATILFLALPACGGIYRLPEPPPESERASVELDPVQEQSASDARYLEARRVLVELYSRLSDARWDESLELLSQETRVLLGGGDSASAGAALASGEVVVRGRAYAFDPIELFLLPDPSGFVDSVVGEVENETPRRKEIFINGADEPRRVVMILEGGAWRLHMRSWPMEYLEREGT